VCTFVDENSYYCKTICIPTAYCIYADIMFSNRPRRPCKHKNHSNNNDHIISSANHRTAVGSMWRSIVGRAYPMQRFSVRESRPMQVTFTPFFMFASINWRRVFAVSAFYQQ
jgi:hypothetical protein